MFYCGDFYLIIGYFYAALDNVAAEFGFIIRVWFVLFYSDRVFICDYNIELFWL